MKIIVRFAASAWSRGAAALLLALAVQILASACASAEPAGAAPKPDPRTQTEIQRVVDAIVARDEHASERLDALADFAGARRKELLLQIALYLANSSSTEQTMGGALILAHMGFTPDEKIDTALPNLRDASGPFRKVLTELLGTIDRPDGAPAEFSVYEGRLRAGRQSASPEQDQLIRYMYETSPDAALRAMQHVYDGAGTGQRGADKQAEALRGILARHSEATAAWSSDDVTAARSALTALARDTGWWVRLYAASVISANPALATPEMKSALEKDSSPLVRAALSR